jgi:NMD protein affecting ribosome stability and mRNA decay
MASCPRCGEKGTKFMRLCGRCEFENTLLSKSKSPKSPIPEPEDDE